MKNKKIKKICLMILILAVIAVPFLSFAQNVTDVTPVEEACGASSTDLLGIICRIGFYLNQIIPILLALGVVYFVWGVITYMIKDDEEAKKKGKNRIIYGIIGLVVIISLWGIVTIVIDSLGIDTQELARITPSTEQITQTYETSGVCIANYKKLSSPVLGDLINYVTCTISKSVIPLLFILAVLLFIWGVVQYVINADSDEKRTKGRDFMIWGIIGLVVMTSIWGLVKIFGDTFDIKTDFVPQVNTQGQ
ncbi:MAG TPA: hypothetical protein PKZ36_02170 [Candidatus Paceibacterota bacterium]|nr:hypothetical protein [Candidatus Paceibacterota bacterium]HPT18189.1 hypothetical protein [Candidatus Paceibacterota bacterium]